MKLFQKKVDIDSAKTLLEQSKWPELLEICRDAGLRNTQFTVLWLTAACALPDQAEISRILEVIEVAPNEGILGNPKLLSRLVSILENTNQPDAAARLLLIVKKKIGWSEKDGKIAARIARITSFDYPVVSADLLLAVGDKLGWQGSQIIRAERLAKRLLEEAPPKGAELLLAVHAVGGWTRPQIELAQSYLPKLGDSSEAKQIRSAIESNVIPKGASNPIETYSYFQFADYDPAAQTFVSPTQFTCDVYRVSPNLATCEQRFRAFQQKFLPMLSAKKNSIIFAKNAYVNKMGQIWTHDGEILFNLGKEITAMRPETFDRVEIGTTMLTATKGIYHWMAETLPSTSWIHQPGAGHLKVAVPFDMPKFKTDTLRFANISSDRLLPVQQETCFFEELHFGWASNSNLLFAQTFFEEFIQRAQSEASFPTHEKIYISRKDSNRRVMENEAELEKALESRGFYIAVLGEMKLADQMTLFSRASTIVSPHGGGLTHLLFARPGTKVVEIVPAFDQISDRSIHLRTCYARISMMKGIKYHLFLEECHMTLRNWKSSLDPILQLVDYVA